MIRPLIRPDVRAWQSLRRSLWPHLSDLDNSHGCEAILGAPERFAVFVYELAANLNGFIEVSLRQYAEGCDSSPVGYIEGWYVVPESRRTGIGRRLVVAAENWARSKGCTEMASDALLDNIDSLRAHGRLGYSEVERQVCFRKDLE